MAGLLAASIMADTINRKPVKKIAFNAAQYSISVSAASLLLILTDVPETTGPLPFGPEDLVPILGVAALFFVVNSALVSTVVALAQGVIKLGRYLANDLFFQASTAGLLLGLSPVVVLAAEFSLPALLLLLLPFLAVHRGGRAAIAKEHQSLHDALTGLPNRTLFRDRIEQAITAGRRADVTSAVMLIDLDHFKEINGTLGHHAGDRLLEEVAHRLQASLGDRDSVARLGGDEFGVLLPALRRPGDANVVARQLLAGLREPFSIEGLTLEVDASIGMACHPRTAPASRRSSSAPTSRCTPPRRAAATMFEPRLDRFSPRRLARRRPAPGDPERRDHALLPARGRASRRARSSASRRSRAGTTRGSGSSARPSSCRSPSRPA